MVTLVRHFAQPSMVLRDAFLDAQRDYASGDGAPDADGLTLADLTQGTLASYIDGTANGLFPRPGVRIGRPGAELWWVGPATEDGNGPEVVGRLSVRHDLVPALHNRGGHLWFSIRPSRRRQGLGTELLRAALPVAAGHGLDVVTLICAATNTAACRTIEAVDGELDRTDELGRRWYKLPTRP
ncbi:GNAT family N-acetyltransferase [Actinomadura yumaensis]|uniref:GNAT family N-acetyltransferase n=1 Tax=Actinomadura yumaensis TaxID=111807 RepID=A0ABW2CP49_9ACTN